MADTGRRADDPTNPNRLVPHWEIQNMINTSISNYDLMIALPRQNKLQECMTSVENLMQQIKGALVVIKWAAASLGCIGTVAGTVYSVARLSGHL